MFKKVLLLMVALVLTASTAFADEDLLSQVGSLKADTISDAGISIESDGLDNLDVDGLASNAGGEKSDEAVEACFRRFGYGHCGYNYNCYGGYGCYQTCYTHYQPFYCYRPVVYHYPVCHYPVYTYTSYWGCH